MGQTPSVAQPWLVGPLVSSLQQQRKLPKAKLSDDLLLHLPSLSAAWPESFPGHRECAQPKFGQHRGARNLTSAVQLPTNESWDLIQNHAAGLSPAG